MNTCLVSSHSLCSDKLTDSCIPAGGDGPKIVELDQMRDKYQTLLRDRVELLGSVKHEDVRGVSPQGSLDGHRVVQRNCCRR